MPYNKIIVFDFDQTLINTQEPEEGRKIWKEKCGTDFPHKGWWSKKETLDINIFYPTINKWTYEHYLKAINDENNYVLLVTGRINELKAEIQNILDHHKFKFNDVVCNWGGNVITFKIRFFESVIRKNITITEFIIYDDRQEHIVKFIEWAKVIKNKYNINVIIIDVIKKETYVQEI